MEEDEESSGLVGPDGSAIVSTVEAEEPEPDWSKTKFPIDLFDNRVVIKRDDREELTAGGIHLPPNAQARTMTATIVAVGSGMKKADGTYMALTGEPPLAVGDRVVFEKFRQMIELSVQGRTYHIVRDNDLLGRINTAIREVRIR